MKYFTLIIFTLTITTVCSGQKRPNSSTMNESRIVISETNDNILYLGNICKYDYLKYGTATESIGEIFYLMFNVFNHSKSTTSGTGSSYMMQVNKIDDNYRMQLRMESLTFYEDGVDMGHADPTGEWYTDDKLSESILNHYLSHQEIIPVYTKNIDVSQWNPLFTVYENSSNQAHVLELTLTKVWPNTRQFEIDCTLLAISNVLINGELVKYSISTHTFLFGQRRNQYFPENIEYYVEEKLNSAKTYTNGGKDVVELTVSNHFGETRLASKYDFAQKVLEYYLEHKSEMEINVENK
ncbi:hypothetical protein M2101_000821 [Parabacteroides sp. PM5-20]|nr:hypothetical protein [Parabacteroides sp. PM5-20]MDH6534163.1 hypothetical protein [Parabacteroides sp. PM5-20]